MVVFGLGFESYKNCQMLLIELLIVFF